MSHPNMTISLDEKEKDHHQYQNLLQKVSVDGTNQVFVKSKNVKLMDDFW